MTKFVSTMALGAALFAAPAFALQGQDQQQQRQQRQQMSQQEQTQRIQGRLIDLREVQMQGEQEPHVLAKVQMRSGRTAVIDLGTPSELRRQQVRLNRGQEMRFTGRQGRVNDLPILIVDRYVGDGEFTIIAPVPQGQMRQAQQGQRQQQMQHDRRQAGEQQRHPMMQMQQRQARQQSQQQRGQQQNQTYGFAQQPSQRQAPMLIQGKLTDLRDVQLQGVSDKQRLAKLEMRNGQTVVLALGTQDQLKDVNLTKGERIAVFGTAGRVNGKPVIFAERIADTVEIDRSQMKQQREQSQQQQSGQESRGQNQQ